MTSVKTVPLTTEGGAAWTVRALDGQFGKTIAATVPGEVHTDLLAAGEIPDPFDGDNESALAWIGGPAGATGRRSTGPPTATPCRSWWPKGSTRSRRSR